MATPQESRAQSSHATRLDRTLKILQDRVKEQESVLAQLRATSSGFSDQPDADDKSHLQQIRALNATYESLTTQDPYLPSPESSLPALLALRSVQNCIDETLESITRTESNLKDAQKRLDNEKADFRDTTLIHSRLKTRIELLQVAIEERSQRTPDQIIKELSRNMNNKKDHYDRETGKLVKAFNGFIDNHLAPMLAAEELGGPIVGEAMDVDEEMLEGGFSSQGRAKKSKNGVNEDKRQRRIDDIWGSKPLGHGPSEETWDEKKASAAEMRDLTEQLLNNIVGADSGASGAYVELERESAAARFLVRSKVAQFHPKDARKLRLVDFGKELET